MSATLAPPQPMAINGKRKEKKQIPTTPSMEELEKLSHYEVASLDHFLSLDDLALREALKSNGNFEEDLGPGIVPKVERLEKEENLRQGTLATKQSRSFEDYLASRFEDDEDDDEEESPTQSGPPPLASAGDATDKPSSAASEASSSTDAATGEEKPKKKKKKVTLSLRRKKSSKSKNANASQVAPEEKEEEENPPLSSGSKGSSWKQSIEQLPGQMSMLMRRVSVSLQGSWGGGGSAMTNPDGSPKRRLSVRTLDAYRDRRRKEYEKKKELKERRLQTLSEEEPTLHKGDRMAASSADVKDLFGEAGPARTRLYEARLYSPSTGRTTQTYLVEVGAFGFTLRHYETGAFLREFPLQHIQSMHFSTIPKSASPAPAPAEAAAAPSESASSPAPVPGTRLFILDCLRTDMSLPPAAPGEKPRILVGRLVFLSEDNEAIFNALKLVMTETARRQGK